LIIIFSAQNVDFNCSSLHLLGLRSFPYGNIIFGYSFKTHYTVLFYCTLYINSPGGSINAVAGHVSFAQITFFTTSGTVVTKTLLHI